MPAWFLSAITGPVRPLPASTLVYGHRASTTVSSLYHRAAPRFQPVRHLRVRFCSKWDTVHPTATNAAIRRSGLYVPVHPRHKHAFVWHTRLFPVSAGHGTRRQPHVRPPPDPPVAVSSHVVPPSLWRVCVWAWHIPQHHLHTVCRGHLFRLPWSRRLHSVPSQHHHPLRGQHTPCRLLCALVINTLPNTKALAAHTHVFIMSSYQDKIESSAPLSHR